MDSYDFMYETTLIKGGVDNMFWLTGQKKGNNNLSIDQSLSGP